MIDGIQGLDSTPGVMSFLDLIETEMIEDLQSEVSTSKLENSFLRIQSIHRLEICDVKDLCFVCLN